MKAANGSRWQDCLSLAPVSEDAGWRRNTFFTMGQQTLFLRCRAEHGRHDFSVGHCAAGPNAFVQCEADLPLADSGAIESWASGMLFDNVRIDGGGLSLVNRGGDGEGAGWSAANSVLWNCIAANIRAKIRPARRTGPLAAGANSKATASGAIPMRRPNRTACLPRNSPTGWGDAAAKISSCRIVGGISIRLKQCIEPAPRNRVERALPDRRTCLRIRPNPHNSLDFRHQRLAGLRRPVAHRRHSGGQLVAGQSAARRRARITA